MNIKTCLSYAAASLFVLMSNSLLAQNVGISTSTPIAPLNVAHGKTVVFGYDSVPGNPIGPMGTLVWFPNKGALAYMYYQSGTIGNAWDPVNIGINSLGIGQYCIASGPQSFAQGYGATASGFYSMARGDAITAGDYGFAMGSGVQTGGPFAFGFGNDIRSLGMWTMAIGSSNISNGTNSTTIGRNLHAKAYNCFVTGAFNDSISSSSNTSWVDTDPLFLIGNGTSNVARKNAVTVLKNGSTGIGVSQPAAYFHIAPEKTVVFGNDSTSSTVGNKFIWFGTKGALRFGKLNSASSTTWDYANIGENSFAVGDYTIASGGLSFAFGSDARATGGVSVAIGVSVLASNSHTVAIGSTNSATEPFAFAVGYNNRSVAMWSTTFGAANNASGAYSTAIGSNLHSKAYDCFVIGAYNDSINSSSTTAWVDTDPLFLIGNGTSNVTRKNAVTVLKNGKVGIGITPVYEFEVTHITGSQGNMGFAIRNTNPGGSNHRWSHYVSDATGDYLLHFDGNLRGTFNNATGAYTNVSDARLKSEITPIGSVLEDVLQLNPTSYFFTSEKHRESKHIGFIAQEVEKLFPSMVQAPNEEQEYFTLDYSGFSVLAIKAIQEQQQIIESLQKQVEAVKAEIPMQIGKQQEIIKKQQTKIDELEKRLKAIEERLK